MRRPLAVKIPTAQQPSGPPQSRSLPSNVSGPFTSRVNAILGISTKKSPVGSTASPSASHVKGKTSKPVEKRVNLVDYSSSTPTSPVPIATEQAVSTTPRRPIAGLGAVAEASNDSQSEAELLMVDSPANSFGGLMDPVSADNSPAHSQSTTSSSQESPPHFLHHPDPPLHFPELHRVSKFSSHLWAQISSKHRVSKFSNRLVNAKRLVSSSPTSTGHPSSVTATNLKSFGPSSGGHLKVSVPVVRKAPSKVRFEIPNSAASELDGFPDYDNLSPRNSPADTAGAPNGLTRTEKGDPPKDPTIGRSNQRNIKKGDSKGQPPILVWIPSAEALQRAKEDRDARNAVHQGLPRSLLDLLHRCLQTGGKTIRRSNPSANSGLELRVCVNSQLKNKGQGACATTEFGRMHRCKRCTRENVSCLYLISEYFGYVMPPIPSDPREREIGVEYQDLAPGIGEEDDARENQVLYETEEEEEGEQEGEEESEEEGEDDF